MKRIPDKTEQNKASKPWRLLAACIVVAAACSAPAFARDLTPEISSRVWFENDSEVAAVCLNGKDLITFRAPAQSGDASEEADDLAARLQDVLADKNFDPSQLLPTHDGDKGVIKLSGNVAATFRAPNAMDCKDKQSPNAMDASLKLVNAIRSEYNAPTLPANFPNLADRAAVASASGSFSGTASWYGPRFHGRKTSDGHRFDMDKLTAAHRSLPFGTKLLVLNRRTGDSCVVEVNDRGPFIGNRVLDLSRGAARRLNMLGSGVAMVDCLIIDNGGN